MKLTKEERNEAIGYALNQKRRNAQGNEILTLGLLVLLLLIPFEFMGASLLRVFTGHDIISCLLLPPAILAILTLLLLMKEMPDL